MTVDEMAVKIFELVKRQIGSTSFAEINFLFETYGFDYKGDYLIGTNDDNIFVWGGWNESAVNAWEKAFKMGLYLEPCSELVYFIDGVSLNMPIVRNARTYKKPHWLPCVISYTEGVLYGR